MKVKHGHEFDLAEGPIILDLEYRVVLQAIDLRRGTSQSCYSLVNTHRGVVKMEINNLLTIDEARCILRVGRNVMYGLIRQQQGLPHIKVGKQIRIPREELYTWIKNHIVAS